MQSQKIIAQNNHNQNISTTINNKKRKNIDANKSFTIPPARSNGSTTQACAACKYQRRKCASDCILAPYFPHDHQCQFLNAHRLFGVSNIVKIIRDLEPEARDLAMRTIMFQSDVRAVDPVGGCHRILRDLEQQIALAHAELQIVHHQLAICRATCHEQQADVGPQPNVGDFSIIGNPSGFYNEKLGEEYAGEGEVAVATDDLDSWGCMYDDVNANESTTSSSYAPNNDLMMSLSMEDCNHEMKHILDNDEDRTYGEIKFDSQGNILPSNNDIFNEENATIFKEEDACFPYNIEDHHHFMMYRCTDNPIQHSILDGK